jgi:hypothetical protein
MKPKTSLEGGFVLPFNLKDLPEGFEVNFFKF